MLGGCISNLFRGFAMLHSAQRSCQTVTCSIPTCLSNSDPASSMPSALLRDICSYGDRNVEANMRRVSISAAGRFEQPLQPQGRGWCEFVNPFGHVNWKNVGQFVGTT